VFEIGDETGEAVAWLPAGPYDSDTRLGGDTSCSPRAGHISVPPPERPTRSSHSGRRLRQHGVLPSHIATKDLGPRERTRSLVKIAKEFEFLHMSECVQGVKGTRVQGEK